MALVLALYLLLCVRVTADVCAGAAKGQIVFSADVGALMFHAQVNGHIHGRKLSMRFPLPALKKKPGAKGLRKGWTMARAVLQSADWELIALHMCAGLEDAGATAMLAGGVRALADGLLAGAGRTSCGDIHIMADFAAQDAGGHGAVHSFHARRRYYACGGESGPEKEAKRGTAMEKHPIESLMGVSMDNIKDMVDVNTVIGDPVQTQDGSTIIPISRVAFGFVAGGGEYAVSGAQTGAYGMPFAGGAGAGVSIHPMGFLVCGRNGVRLLSAGSASPMERVAELIPQALESIKKMDEDEERERPPQVQAAYRE